MAMAQSSNITWTESTKKVEQRLLQVFLHWLLTFSIILMLRVFI